MMTVTYAECQICALYAECHYAECLYAECCYAECHSALKYGNKKPKNALKMKVALVNWHI